MPSLGRVLVTHNELVSWIQTTVLGRVLLAIFVLFLGWYGSKLIVKLLGRRIARRFERPSITRTVLRAIRAFVMFIALIMAAFFLGFDAQNIALSVTIFSAVVGIILAPIAGSIINGLFVLADRPFEIGDMIEIVDSEQRGFVEDITLRYTKIVSDDNTILVIPNSTIRERDVINYSAEDERTRLSLEIIVSYEGDLDKARSIIERSARNVEEVITGGPTIRIGSARYSARPRCHIREFGDNGVHLLLRYWARTPYYLGRVQSEVNERVWTALAEETVDVSIPYPHRHLIMDETNPLSESSASPSGVDQR